MVRIDRGAEPRPLSAVRRRQLARLRKALAAGEPLTRKLLGRSYRAPVYKLLHRRQLAKCCYCERIILSRGNDVEHYRPAVAVRDAKSSPRVAGYWWLAWSWPNLLFSCRACNEWEKNDIFPLAAGSSRLAAQQHPPGAEAPLLIDPATEEPLDHIQFRRVRRHWRPLPRAGSQRGYSTIGVIGLSNQGLLDLYSQHVQHMTPLLNAVATAISSGVASAITACWGSLVGTWLAPTQQFLALAHDVIDHHFPAAVRAQWGLDLPRPGLP